MLLTKIQANNRTIAITLSITAVGTGLKPGFQTGSIDIGKLSTYGGANKAEYLKPKSRQIGEYLMYACVVIR